VRSILVKYNHRTCGDYFNGTQAWFLRECYLAKQVGATEYPSDLPPDGSSKEEWQKEKAAHIVRHYASHVFAKEVQSLTAVFKAGVDPHLATALTVLRLRGTFEFPGTATEYLASLSLEEQEKLKITFKTARQEAKAVNFGLLYGMQAAGLHRYGIVSYGLKWTLKDAEEAYRMWFDLYPEIGFYHCFVSYMRSTKIQPEGVKLWDKYNQGYKAKTYPAKRFRVTSLAGRPFDILDEKNDALSYPGQGSGADLTVRAIASLPQDLADCLALVIHDEIGLHMPPNAPDGALVALEQVMNKAGDDLLGDYCKCATEGKVHDRWSK
jgi:DNA polymerase-1